MPFLMVHAKPPSHLTTKNPSGESPEKIRPPPLQFMVPQSGDSPESPLTELSSSPLSPFPLSADPESEAFSAGGSVLLRQEEHRLLQSNVAGGVGARQSNPVSGDRSHLSATIDPINATSSNQAQDRFGSPSYQLYEQKVQPQRAAKPLEPRALCLRILPTKKTFPRAGEPKTVKWGHGDMKIDVFLNGDLCSSAYIPEPAFHKKDALRDTFCGARVGWMTEKPWVLLSFASETCTSADDHIGQNLVAEVAASRWDAIATPLKLAAQSNERGKNGELSRISDYLQSLACLPMPAALPEMLKMDNQRFAILDVIVTLGKGRKEEASAPYLMRPLPLKIHGFGTHRDSSPLKVLPLESRKRDRSAYPSRSAADAEILSQQFSLGYVRRGNSGRINHIIDDHENQIGNSGQPNCHHSKGQLTVPGHSIIAVTNSPPALATSATTQRPRSKARLQTTSMPLISPSNQARRPRMMYHDVIDTRQTREEELIAIMDQAVSLNTGKLVTRSRLADATLDATSDATLGTTLVADSPAYQAHGAAADNSIDTPEPLSPTKMVTPRFGSPQHQSAPEPPENDSSPSRPGVTNSLRPLITTANATFPPPSTPLPITIDHNPPPTVTSTSPFKRRKLETADASSPEQPLIQLRHKTPNGNDAHPSNPSHGSPKLDTSSTPLLPLPAQPITAPSNTSMDPPPAPNVKPSSKQKNRRKTSVVYQKPVPFVMPELSKGAVVSFAEGEMVRQVRSERGGWFREEDVLVGMRFVVG